MKSSSFAAVATLALAAAISSSDAATTVAKDCTQAERQFVNSLLQQDKNPFQSCAARARGDITVLSTSRLCPITECKVWIEYMAETAPNCVYDDTNYGASFIAKAKDCGSVIGSGSTGNDADTPSAGNSTTLAPTPSSTTSAPSTGSRGGSKSGSKDDDDENTIEEPVSTIPTVTVPTTPTPTTQAPITPPPSGAASLSVAASLSAVVLSVAALAF